MNEEEARRIIGVLHVDADAPNVIIKGDAVYVYHHPADEPIDPATVDEKWQSLGWTEDYDPEARHFPVLGHDAGKTALRAAGEKFKTLWPHQLLAVESMGMDADTVRTLLGFDPARDGSGDPVFAMTFESVECPVIAPRKRRGLTGKAYRIARRRYARDMKRWRRGLLPGLRVRRAFPHVRPVSAQRVGQDSFSVGFELGAR